MTTPKPRYRTDDLYFAAFLMTMEVTYVGLERANKHNNKCLFAFELSDIDAIDFSRAWNDGLEIEARNYSFNVRTLKSLLHDRPDA